MAAVANHSNVPYPQRPWWRLPTRIAFFGFLGVALYFLVTEHTAHFFGFLPFALLGGCVVMHLFMHHGDGGHDAMNTKA